MSRMECEKEELKLAEKEFETMRCFSTRDDTMRCDAIMMGEMRRAKGLSYYVVLPLCEGLIVRGWRICGLCV